MKSQNPKKQGDRHVVLVIEDDMALREGLAMNLRMQGYEVLTAGEGESGMKMAFDARADLIVLDIMMPAWSGLDILDELRKRGNAVPVLVLSARNTTADKVRGLNTGADDYMTKPFDLPELMARVQAMLRRKNVLKKAPKLAFGDMVIDPGARAVKVKDTNVDLTAREFDLIYLLGGSPGQVFSRETILERVWGWDYEGTDRTVDNFVAGLRKKLKMKTRTGARIVTVPRVGYKLETHGAGSKC
ncbi:MAG: response regulator transcription factor [Kiritimatiellia bacterium]